MPNTNERDALPIGSVLIDKNGEAHRFSPRIRDFFGAILDDDAYVHDAEDVKRADQDAAGLAPHRAELVYAATAPNAGAPLAEVPRKPMYLPSEPTQAMLLAGRAVNVPALGLAMNLSTTVVGEIYRAMLDAAPVQTFEPVAWQVIGTRENGQEVEERFPSASAMGDWVEAQSDLFNYSCTEVK